MTDRLVVLGWRHPDGTPPTVEEDIAICTGPLHAGTVLRAELRLLTRDGQVDEEAMAWLRDGQARGLWLRVALAGGGEE